MPLASFLQPRFPQAAAICKGTPPKVRELHQSLSAIHYSVSSQHPKALGNLHVNNQSKISFLLLCMTTCTYLTAIVGQNFSLELRTHCRTKSHSGINGLTEMKMKSSCLRTHQPKWYKALSLWQHMLKLQSEKY